MGADKMSGQIENPTPIPQTGTVTSGMEFQLAMAIAGLQADMKHVRDTGDKTHEAINGLSDRVSNLETDVATLKARPANPSPDPKLGEKVSVLEERTTAQNTVIATLQAALESKSLSWPKLLTGLAAVVGAVVALGLYSP